MAQAVFCQQDNKPFSLGFCYGFGDEIRKKDYAFSNHFIKAQLRYELKATPHFSYEIVVQPEVNFAQHQLLNKYFVQSDEPNYEEKRARFTQLKDIRECILNVGILVRKPISRAFSLYLLGSIGPMVTDTETERLSKGFAFSDVLALGLSFRADKTNVDVRPSLRHVSNGGFQKSNAGFNTQNIEICVTLDL